MIWIRTIWYILTLRCEEADRLRSRARGGELTRTERVAERLHRSLCSSCRKAAAQLDQIDRALEHLADGLSEGRAPDWDEQRAARLDEAMRRAQQES
ncbi:MAG: hypothetical protein H6810_05445 [Phycisphaeraceae bacterium]|nr:MAG: hypothetical protein H6810_05445 [Phycisphaeraceae bacterium]